ncbi:hypothetical protein GC176_14130 [bacterium]|nr:hypothetical protein [bacterium]
MTQRTRNSAALALLGAAGVLAAVGAACFNGARPAGLSAAEGAGVGSGAFDSPAAPEAKLQEPPPLVLKPQPAPPIGVAPLPVASTSAIQRVPAFTEMEAKAEAVLDLPVTVRFEDVDLKTAFDKLAELAGVPVGLGAGLGQFGDEFGYESASRFSAEFKGKPLSLVIQKVFMAAFEIESLSPPDSLFSFTFAPTASGIEFGICGYGPAATRDTRIYLVGHLLHDSDDCQRIIELLCSQSGGYWNVSTSDGRGGVRVNGTVMTTADDNDVLVMAQMAGSIVYLKSMRVLVVTANPQAQYKVVTGLRLLNDAYQAVESFRLQPMQMSQASLSTIAR